MPARRNRDTKHRASRSYRLLPDSRTLYLGVPKGFGFTLKVQVLPDPDHLGVYVKVATHDIPAELLDGPPD